MNPGRAALPPPQIRRRLGDDAGAASAYYQALQLDTTSPKALTGYAVLGIETSMGDAKRLFVLSQCRRLLQSALHHMGPKPDERLVACAEFHLGVVAACGIYGGSAGVEGAHLPTVVGEHLPTAVGEHLRTAAGEAEAHFRRALEAAPDYQDAAVNLASVLIVRCRQP